MDVYKLLQAKWRGLPLFLYVSCAAFPKNVSCSSGLRRFSFLFDIAGLAKHV